MRLKGRPESRGLRILLVRHAEAVEREGFIGSDLDRPLTKQGRENAGRAYRTLARMVDAPDIVLTSKAVRALQTAEILRKCFAIKEPCLSDKRLNPGSAWEDLQGVMETLPRRIKRIAVVGHEPDLSCMLARISGTEPTAFRVGKGTCLELEMSPDARGIIRALFPLKALIRAAKRVS